MNARHKSDVHAWIERHFAAKRRQYAAAGYPADISGLFDPHAQPTA